MLMNSTSSEPSKLEQITKESVDEAIRLLRRAVELDPTLARAWVELNAAYNASGAFGGDRDAKRLAAREAAERAIALDPLMRRLMSPWPARSGTRETSCGQRQSSIRRFVSIGFGRDAHDV